MVGGESLSVNGRRQRAAFISRCFPRIVHIPVDLRDLPLAVFCSLESVLLTETFGIGEISTRLADALRNAGIRFLRDLHGRAVGDFAWKKNCSFETLHELDSLARCLAGDPSSRAVFAGDIKSSTDKRRKNILSRGIPFAIPESVSRLRFDELPITRRLANVLRSISVRTLSDLDGWTALELLERKTCGWRTVAEIQQLVERAIDGEFNQPPIKVHTAAGELVQLLEQAIAKLPPHQGEFVLARIEGLTFGEIGRRYGLTRARVHQVFEMALGTLKKTYGPRIPRLLELLKRRCMSIPNGAPLTPALLEQWIDESLRSQKKTRGHTKSFGPPGEAQVRLIAALDRTIPCYVQRASKSGAENIDLAGLARALRLASTPENPPLSGTSVREPPHLTNDRYYHRYDDNRNSMLPRRSFVGDS